MPWSCISGWRLRYGEHRYRMVSEYYWSTSDFEKMSWHDNHVHALRIVEGEYGAGQLILELDYILEWRQCGGDGCQFLILPSMLSFHELTNLRIALDYQTATAALVPFSIHDIERRFESRERYQATLWKIAINWPIGEISFEAKGFEQRGIASPVLSDQQLLSAAARGV